jgi:GDP-L-fucose synthase
MSFLADRDARIYVSGHRGLVGAAIWARAVVFLLRNYDGDQHVNIGTGSDVTIADLAARIARVVGYDGTISWDTSRPDGTPRKLLDVTKLAQLGWTAQVELDEGIESVYQWFRGNRSALRL